MLISRKRQIMRSKRRSRSVVGTNRIKAQRRLVKRQRKAIAVLLH